MSLKTIFHSPDLKLEVIYTFIFIAGITALEDIRTRMNIHIVYFHALHLFIRHYKDLYVFEIGLATVMTFLVINITK